MHRPLPPEWVAALESGSLRIFVAAALTFRSKTEYCWTGRGTLTIDGNAYLGVGLFARVGLVTEGTEVRADGTTIGLTALDPALYAECVADIQQGLPAKLYAGMLTDDGQLFGAPYLYFLGQMDAPHFDLDPDNMTVTLDLEHEMAELQRAHMLRYTSADQALEHPDDSGFDKQELLQDMPLRWGTG